MIFKITAISICSILISFGILVFISELPSAVGHGDWQNIMAGSVSVKKINQNITELSLQTAAPIPHVERIILGGFGWIYEDGNSALVVTSHYGIRDSKQNPDHWHIHNLTFESVDSASFSHCVTGITTDETAGIAINQDKIKVNINNKNLASTLKSPPIAMSFDIMPDPLKTTCSSGVGIGIHTTEPKPEVIEQTVKGGPKK